MALTCPQCTATLNEVTAEATVGYLIQLDQCPQCGGIWCDRWELYPITAAAAERLDAVDQATLWQPTRPGDEQHPCPRCRARMFRFRDPSLPADARIERCPNCDGMWLNRGELRRIKRKGAAPAAATAVSDADLDRLARRALGNPKGAPITPPTVTTLGSAFEGRAADTDAEDLKGQLASGAAWLIVRAALRLLLGV